MKKFLFSIVSVCVSLTLYAQTVSIKGVVSNQDGEPLVGASVYNPETYSGTVTNSRGEYHLKVKPGKVPIAADFLGFKTFTDTIESNADRRLNIKLKPSPFVSKEFVVEATRASQTTPIAYENVSKEELERVNLAQDMPILLNQTVSAVTTSDAGAGVGYTGIRIRGSDATRINVTVNGVPLNDAESHGVFWVNMPDFASNTENIQIQRGVGTSTNGAAAFGATINLETSDLDSNAYVEFNNSYGSFNTRRHNVIYNSGLMNDHFQFEGRLSFIGSDGYIDRSASDLRSYYFSGGYFGEKVMIKGLTFAGREVTQQAWWGTPESRLNGDEEAMLTHAINEGYSEAQTENLLTSGRTYNYYLYDNEIDNYSQDHYQLITGIQLSDHLYLNLTGHYTYGRGYFEQFNGNDDISEFGLDYPVFGGDTLTNGDVIVRRWLENHFYGGVFSLQYNKGAHKVIWGGAANEYIGDHFGEVIWSELALGADIRDRYYESTSKKQDASSYLKWQWTLGSLTLFADAQGRFITYKSNGVDNDQRPIQIDEEYLFFNPKFGLNYQLDARHRFYASVARSNREPVRNDFTDADVGITPMPEQLTDVEAGYSFRSRRISAQFNAYYMHYENQLVLTGQVNDVGAPIRTNVPVSYRAGLETSLRFSITDHIYWEPNATISQNKIRQYTQVLYDYTNGFEVIENEQTNTDIAFSPWLIAGSQLGFTTDFGLEGALLSKYIGRQYLDNTSTWSKSIAPYFVNDLRLSLTPKVPRLKRLTLSLLINNIFNEMYSANGYTYSYIFGDLITENFYYPQAGTNFLAGLKVRF